MPTPRRRERPSGSSMDTENYPYLPKSRGVVLGPEIRVASGRYVCQPLKRYIVFRYIEFVKTASARAAPRSTLAGQFVPIGDGEGHVTEVVGFEGRSRSQSDVVPLDGRQIDDTRSRIRPERLDGGQLGAVAAVGGWPVRSPTRSVDRACDEWDVSTTAVVGGRLLAPGSLLDGRVDGEYGEQQ